MKLEKKLKARKHRELLSNLEAYTERWHSVYVLWCPLDKQVKYVGYTSNYPWSRLGAHLAEAKMGGKSAATDKVLWIRSLIEKGHAPVMRIIRCFKSKIHAYRLEAELIESLGCRRVLMNSSAGNPNWGERYAEFGHNLDWRSAV